MTISLPGSSDSKYFSCGYGIQPTPANLLQPMTPANQQQNNITSTNTKTAVKLGATWADTKGAINIDVDNLLSPKSPKAGPAPSINQLKSTPNSPAHKTMPNIATPNIGMPMTGMMSPQMGFNFPPMMNNNFPQQTGNFINNNMQQANFANPNSFLQ